MKILPTELQNEDKCAYPGDQVEQVGRVGEEQYKSLKQKIVDEMNKYAFLMYLKCKDL